MLVTSETSTSQGRYDGFRTALLVGESNSGSREISIQITHVGVGGSQSLHHHPEDQCYYIVAGTGCMRIEDEAQVVSAGAAIFIPGDSVHGIENLGDEELVYLTANKAFGIATEARIWPHP